MSDRAAETRTLLMNLARNLRAARLRLGLPLEDLAYLAEVEISTIQAVERGEGDAVDLAALGRLAWALGVTPDDLIAPPGG
ncbi:MULTISPECIES: helix-turn-helix domain-containing protein [Methylobacterium]|uniref:helix-turn-helix domain-containing protein n=1 Tax=Methylobacterium TaxID=407 RepID=UPI00138EDA10|nr:MULTISPECIES: helix-turn-helix transcriptional regulator [Methylobacterium]MCI9882784.1 helix-turn-helix domain-containing protein [Methylobacterium goesingense]